VTPELSLEGWVGIWSLSGRGTVGNGCVPKRAQKYKITWCIGRSKHRGCGGNKNRLDMPSQQNRCNAPSKPKIYFFKSRNDISDAWDIYSVFRSE
jgi:hypothetical protein